MVHAVPTGSRSVHEPALPQYSLLEQSASLVQPLLHCWVLVLQPPRRHWSEFSQGLLPGVRPHLPSTGSQTADWHTMLPTAAVHVLTRPGSLGRGMPLAIFRTHMPALSLHHSVFGHSMSTRQPVLHRPLIGSQTVPPWPRQFASELHFPQAPSFAPARAQNGAASVAHGLVAVEPLSPLHFTQVEAPTSQIGVSPLHAPDEVHCTHLPLFRLQTGVSPEHCASSVQSTHVPSEAPLVAQRPERHTLAASAAVHGPTPVAKPHSSSFVSHTPLTQTKAAAASVQVPSSFGLVWGSSVGSGVPFASRGKQAAIATLHHLPAAQSASTLQPSAGWQRPLALQVAERHTTAPLSAVHGPWPVAKPH